MTNQTQETRPFDYAASIMHGIRSSEIETFKTRDNIFNEILSTFDGKPVRIYQVGAIETFSDKFRVFSGWSDLVWGKYIKEHGGELKIMDIDLDHLAHSAFAAQSLGYQVQLCYGDGAEEILSQDYDIYYLDGSNDPQETLDQYEKIKDKDAVVIIDDYDIKGTLINEDEIENIVKHELFNGVTVIDQRRAR